MELQLWMERERWTDRKFASEISAIIKRNKPHKRTVSWRTVVKWRTGEHIPRPHVSDAIEVFTNREVTFEDHRKKNAAYLAAKEAA